MSRFKLNVKRFNWPLLLCTVVILAMGLLALWSASLHSDLNEQTFAAYHLKQMKWIMIGAVVAVFVCVPNYTWFSRYSYSLYGLLLALVLLVALIGVSRLGAKRWLDLRFMLFQPSEFLKIVLVLAMAKYLMYRENYSSIKSLIGPMVLVMIPFILVAKQPDLGTALVFPPVFLVMVFVAGAKRKHLAIIIGFAVAMIPISFFFILREYQRARILAFLNPEQYELRESYQLIQSVEAVGSGKLTGKGFGQGSQNLLDFIPEKHNDFIFSVMGEEWGFIGCVLFLLVYLFFLYACLAVALRTKEPFARLTVVGISSIFAFQFLVNVGMAMGLMPITGMTLPLMSYGGSSLLSSLIGVAIILNISMRQVFSLKSNEEDGSSVDYTTG